MGFGLSPQVGHLPAARATLCAMECTERLRAKGLARCHAGVATGPVFCGSLGSEDRCSSDVAIVWPLFFLLLCARDVTSCTCTLFDAGGMLDTSQTNPRSTSTNRSEQQKNGSRINVRVWRRRYVGFSRAVSLSLLTHLSIVVGAVRCSCRTLSHGKHFLNGESGESSR